MSKNKKQSNAVYFKNAKNSGKPPQINSNPIRKNNMNYTNINKNRGK